MNANFLRSFYFLLVFGLLLGISSCVNDDTESNEINKSELVKDQSREIIKEWFDLYLKIEKDIPLFRPAVTSRALGLITLSGYEAGKPGMPGFRSYNEFNADFVAPKIDPSKQYYWPAAINIAFAKTFKYFIINSNSEHHQAILALENKLNDRYRQTQTLEVMQNSIEWGAAVGDAVVQFGKADIEAETQCFLARPDTHNPPVGPGFWVSTDANPHGLSPYWGKTKTFFTPEAAQVSKPPIAYSEVVGSAYYNEAKEVYDVWKNLSYEDKWKAEFWSDDIVGLTFSPPARVFAMANQLIDNYNLDLETTLHLYLKLGMASNDAAVACWNSKYIYNIERPVTYIQKFIDPNFKPLLGRAIGHEGVTPPFPAYPSGHSTFAGMSSGVFIAFFGNSTNFTDRCHADRTEFYGAPRTFHLFTDLAEENAYSRIPLGVHFRMDCVEGLRLGYEVADYVNKVRFKK